MAQSPSIMDVGYSGQQITPASSFVSLKQEHGGVIGNSAPVDQNGQQNASGPSVGYFTVNPSGNQAMGQAATPKMNSGHSINKDLMAAQAMSSGASQHYQSAKIGSQ